MSQSRPELTQRCPEWIRVAQSGPESRERGLIWAEVMGHSRPLLATSGRVWSLWATLALFLSIYPLWATLGIFRSSLVLSGPFLALLSHSGPLWSTPVNSGPCLATLGHCEPLQATFGKFGPHWSSLCPFWSTLVHSGKLWTIFSHFGPLQAVFGHFGPHW